MKLFSLLICSLASLATVHACEKNCREAFIGPVLQWFKPRIVKAYQVLEHTILNGLDDDVLADLQPKVHTFLEKELTGALSEEVKKRIVRHVFGGFTQNPARNFRGGDCCACCTNNSCKACPGGQCNDRSKNKNVLEEFRSGRKVCGSEYAAKTHMKTVLLECERLALSKNFLSYAGEFTNAASKLELGHAILERFGSNVETALKNFRNAYRHLGDGLHRSVGGALADHFICVDHRKDQRSHPPGQEDAYKACRSHPNTDFIPPSPDMSGGRKIPNVPGLR